MVMPAASVEERGRVIGIGGVFIKSPNHESLRSWYQDNLGLRNVPGQGVTLRWRSHENPDEEHFTVWSAFASASKYFDPSTSSFMINYVVDDLEALLGKLQKQGVKIDPKREEYDYGRFAWVYDPDGNKIELWEPTTSKSVASG